MNRRIFSVLTTVTLILLSTGCSGMRDFMFGRGARCGLCNRSNPQPPAAFPYGPPPAAPPMAAPGCCGCNGYPAAGHNSYVGSGYVGGDCGCGVTSGYGTVVDPYLGATTIDDSWQLRQPDGSIIIDETISQP